MLSTESLRNQFDRYAEGSLSAEALEEWLASESWDMRRGAPTGLQRLIESIQSAFIRHASGELSHDALACFLRDKTEQLSRAKEATALVELPHSDGMPVAASMAVIFSPELVPA